MTATTDPTPDLDALGLAGISRPGTATYRAMQMLLSGKPVTKKEIEEETGTVGPTVARLMSRLEQHGVKIKSQPVRPGAKEKRFQAALPPPPAVEDGIAFPVDGEPVPVSIVSLSVDDGQIHVSLGTPLGAVSGILDRFSMSTLGEQPAITRVRLLAGGALSMILSCAGEEFVLSEVKWL